MECTSPPSPRAARIAAEPLAAACARATAMLATGGLVALPTETVYGLCALAGSPSAVAALYAAKGRPAHNPLIVHVADLAAAHAVACMSPLAVRLAEAFWPGPLTLVLPRRADAALAPAATAGGASVAVRVPVPALFRAVARAVGPLVAPSANRSGRVSATTADAVEEELGARIDLIIDGGPCPVGVESTVLDLTGTPCILRPGAIAPEALAAVVGGAVGLPETRGAAASAAAASAAAGTADGTEAGLPSPGLLASHYAPRAQLRLDVAPDDVRPDEAWLALGAAESAAPPERTVRLSPTGDIDEAARHLYEGLRTLDATGAATIAVSPIPGHGIGAAIRDRLRRAAAPRPCRPPAPQPDETA